MTISEAWVDFIAGWASGAVAVGVCQPVDTILTRVQAGDALVIGTGTGSGISGRSNVAAQTRGLVQNFGISSLWRGSSAMISAVPMQNALLMGGYGVGKQWAVADEEARSYSKTLISVFVGGCTGGIGQSFLMSPVELMKVNQQVHATKSAHVAGRELLQGWSSSSWRGLNATLLRDGIPHGVWFASYELAKTELSKYSKGTSGEQVTVPLISGAFAATVAWAVGYPFDIIKTRIQASSCNNGIYATGVQLLHESNGRIIPALYRGFGLKLVRAVPASMIGFLTYETVADSIRGQ